MAARCPVSGCWPSCQSTLNLNPNRNLTPNHLSHTDKPFEPSRLTVCLGHPLNIGEFRPPCWVTPPFFAQFRASSSNSLPSLLHQCLRHFRFHLSLVYGLLPPIPILRLPCLYDPRNPIRKNAKLLPAGADGDRPPELLLCSKPIFSERELTFTFAICCRPSVCLSVTFVRSTQAVQIFGNISAALDTLAIH